MVAEARRASWLLGVSMLAAIVSAFVPGCLDSRQAPETDPDVARCTSCHGDAERDGDYVLRSAPPIDLFGQTATSYPGVGAHAIHLYAGSTHGAVACEECHAIPKDVDSPGHADDARPAELTFGPLARTGNRDPSYEAEPQTCSNTYCHGDAWPVWSLPRTSDEACGSCHGLPPPAPHPQSDRCSACHGAVVDDHRRFVAPERHVNGIVDYAANDCTLCHGGADDAAPPLDVSGNDAITAMGVGAHQAHLAGGDNGRPLECDECHRVPDDAGDPAHADGLPAEVALRGVAESGGFDPMFDASNATCSAYCHAPSPGDVHASPVWNEDVTLDCTGCHGAPPPAPHPQMTDCSMCHADVVGDDDSTIIDKSRHVDGIVQVKFDDSCNACHGGDNAAPPLDVEGNSRTTVPGVGAHQTHVLGTARSRAVPCDVCHAVPDDVFDPGHMDTARPAEVVFSGIATINGAKPAYERGTCTSTPCHGAVFPDGHDSGGSNTAPDWTRVGEGEAQCGSCHGLPPPPPHPLPTYPCQDCHRNVADDGVTFTRPDLHVDGVVTFAVDD